MTPKPGYYSVHPDDDKPTDPGTPAATTARKRISLTAANDDEIRALDAIVRAWLRMGNEERILISQLCLRLAPLADP